jgi:hypothetical protein
MQKDSPFAASIPLDHLYCCIYNYNVDKISEPWSPSHRFSAWQGSRRDSRSKSVQDFLSESCCIYN